jgi:hypothetical protein
MGIDRVKAVIAFKWRFDMRKIALTLAVLGTTLLAGFYTAPAHAQATRTWVSGVGDDANPCSRTAPCKTWAGAISKTAAGGEIDVLDPGGFGAVTITKSITIDGKGGGIGSALVAGTNGIVVAAGATDYVILRNIQADGLLGSGNANAGINGIKVISAAQVTIDGCDIFGFGTNGIDVELSTTGLVRVYNTTLRNNAQNAVFAKSTSGFAAVQVSNSSIGGTIVAGAPVQTGVNAASGGAITVFNTTFQGLATGANVQAGGILNVDSSSFSSTTNAISTAAGTTFPTNVSNNSFYNAGTAFGGAGSYTSAGNNRIGNGTAQGANPAAMTVK